MADFGQISSGQPLPFAGNPDASMASMLSAVQSANQILSLLVSAMQKLSTTNPSTVYALNATATAAGGFSLPGLAIGQAALGIYWGSGAPTISAPHGSLYLRTDGSSTTTRAYLNTNGSTTWTSVTTAT